MRRLLHPCIAMCLLWGAVDAPAQQAAESKLRIGVMTPTVTGAEPEFGKDMAERITLLVDQQGGYQVLDQAALEKEFASVGKRMPRYCTDPRCVLGVGNTARLDRIIYGSVDKGPKTYGVDITMMDVTSRMIINRVKLETIPGGTMDDLLRVAVARLHGQKDENISYQTYFGPQIHHEREMLYSTAGLVALSFFWGLADGSLTGRDRNPAVVEYDYSSLNEDLKNESGIPAGSNIIPVFGRPAALADAYVAASDDAYGVLYNPAGMAWVGKREAALGYQYRFGPMNLMAASYVNKATREIGFGHAFYYASDKDHLLNETQFTSAFAYKVNRMPLKVLRPMSLGVAVRALSRSAKGSSPSSSTGNAFGLGVDWGLRWQLSEEITYGLLFRDAPGFVRWHNTATNFAYTEFQPATCLMGGAFQAGYYTFLIAEGQIPLHRDQSWKMAGGIEQEFFRFLKGRIGLKKEILTPAKSGWIVTAGFALNTPIEVMGMYVMVDGSYEYNQNPMLSNPLNISFRIGF